MSKRKALPSKPKKILPNHFEKIRRTTHILYRCFNHRGRLLYVGMTNHPELRFKHHQANKAWWKYVDHITLQQFASRRLLIEAEAAAIEIEHPQFNVVTPRGVSVVIPRSGGMRMPRRLWSHASNFATVVPEDGFLIEKTLEQQLYPCVECHARDIYCENDTVGCATCLASWSYDEWFSMTFYLVSDTPEKDQLTLM